MKCQLSTLFANIYCDIEVESASQHVNNSLSKVLVLHVCVCVSAINSKLWEVVCDLVPNNSKSSNSTIQVYYMDWSKTQIYIEN